MNLGDINFACTLKREEWVKITTFVSTHLPHLENDRNAGLVLIRLLDPFVVRPSISFCRDE